MDQSYEQLLREKRRQEATHPIRDAAKSAGLWGGIAGASSALLNGNRSIPSVLKRGLGAAAIAAPTVAAATGLGDQFLGEPAEDDPTGYSVRGGLGGAVGGAGLGGSVGYLLGSGRLRHLTSAPFAPQVERVAKEALPLDNIIVDKLRHWAMHPSHESGVKAAALLGLGGGALLALHGATEGMDIDFMRNLRLKRQEKEAQDAQLR